MRPHNVQEQTQSSHAKFEDFQTRKIDQTQKLREMPGMLGMQPAGHTKVQKKQDLLIFLKINHQKKILATPRKYPQNILPKTLENYRVFHTQHAMPKKWQPQKPSALIRDPKLHARLALADFTFGENFDL